MEIFNKYGAFTFDSPIYIEAAVVEDVICHFIEKAKEMGATPVEIRALGQHLMASVACAVSESVLTHAVSLLKKEREIII